MTAILICLMFWTVAKPMFRVCKGSKADLEDHRNETMTDATRSLTLEEIYAYEAKAHVLRAEAMRAGILFITNFIKSQISRVMHAFSRPAHA